MTRGLPSFTLERPTDLRSAALMLAEPGACALGGGTDLLPNLRRGIGAPATLVDLNGVPEISGMVREPDGTLVIGAATSVQALAEDAGLAQALPALAEPLQLRRLRLQPRGRRLEQHAPERLGRAQRRVADHEGHA